MRRQVDDKDERRSLSEEQSSITRRTSLDTLTKGGESAAVARLDRSGFARWCGGIGSCFVAVLDNSARRQRWSRDCANRGNPIAVEFVRVIVRRDLSVKRLSRVIPADHTRRRARDIIPLSLSLSLYLSLLLSPSPLLFFYSISQHLSR